MSSTEGLFRKARADTIDRIIKTQDPTLFKAKLFREPQSEKAHLTSDVRKQKYNQIEQDIKSTVKAEATKRQAEFGVTGWSSRGNKGEKLINRLQNTVSSI